MRRRQYLQTSLLMCAAGLVGCEPKTTRFPKDSIVQKFSLRTWAFGRYLTDMPEKTEQQVFRAAYAGCDIALENRAMPSLQAFIEDRVKSLKSNDPFKNKFKTYINGIVPNSFIVTYTDTPSIPSSGGTMLGFLGKDEKSHFILSTLYGSSSESKISSFANEIFQVIRTTLITTDSTAKGFVIDGGYIADTDPEKRESLSAIFKLNGDILFEVQMQVDDVKSTSEGLNARVQKGLLIDTLSNTTSLLRNGKRTVANMAGEEAAYKTSQDSEDSRAYWFAWEFSGEPNSLRFPQIKLKFETSNRGYTEDEVSGLWDAILQSFRVRPGST